MIARVAALARRWRPEKWTGVAVAAAFLAALAVVFAATQSESVALQARTAHFQSGTVAEKDFVVARDFTYVDEKATVQKREARARLVPPVFALNAESTGAALRAFDTFTSAVNRLINEGASREKIVLRTRIDFPERFPPGDVGLLLEHHGLPRAFKEGRRLLEVALSRGITDLRPVREAALSAGSVEVRRMQDGRVQSVEVPLDFVITPETVVPQMEGLAFEDSRNDAERRIVLLLLRAFAVANSSYDEGATLANRNLARAAVEPFTEKLARGQILVRKGDLVSESTAMKIRALSEHARTVNLDGLAGSALFLLLTFILAAYLISLRGAGVPLKRSLIQLILALGMVHLVVSALAVLFFPIPVWLPVSVAIPTSAMSMLIAILVSTPVGVYFSLATSLALLLSTGMGIQGFLFAFLSGIAGTAVVLRADKRIDLIRAGLILSLIDSGILAILGLLADYDIGRFLTLAGWGIANGFLSGILTLGFLPIFEHLLNAPTRFKLMELSDLNSPIFKRMLSQAPGTYTHSINVANLAETACEAIGANALLARVSAYYHDIGKIDQADYFIENQKAFNKHDEMKPSLSVAVIKSHVRIGVEKARELKLPQAIVDILAQHHGRGLITYFYNRAVKLGENPRVSRDDYSYPGVRPKTKEAAVLMLADTVEAASRTLKRPTESRVETFVQEVIMDKFNSGELGDSNLTLRDLESIRKSFVHILEGYFHTRIEYPKLARSAPLNAPTGEARA